MAIVQDHLPDAPWMAAHTRRLPGIGPVAPGDWLRVDSAYGAQMAERARLIAQTPELVHALDEGARPAAEELLETVLSELPALGFARDGDRLRRPDGAEVAIDRAQPLLTLGHLLQEDFCILENRGGPEHVLTGAILCFPASWTLAQKYMRPLTTIHVPVHSYDAGVAARVQRLFDAIRVDQPLWRANAMFYADPSLFQPRREGEVRALSTPTEAQYIRSERQCLRKLPQTGAVIFSIHTVQVLRRSLTPEQEAGLQDNMIETEGASVA